MLFVSLLFLKVFHWLASDRVEMVSHPTGGFSISYLHSQSVLLLPATLARHQMEQTAQVTRLAHVRMIGILSNLWFFDVVLLIFAVEAILIEGPTVMIMFASEVSSCRLAGLAFRHSARLKLT